ncbi:MAG: hypothetical protein M0Z33_08120 [Actinomycetota bacterium]|nr:hypothetical protein [Actinomycetota bacterium]
MRVRWLSPRSVALHVAVVAWTAGCSVAAWWQVTVALGGDRLGYVYSVEWPCFGVFGWVVWWHRVHDDPATVGSRALETSDAPDVAAVERDARRIAELERDDPGLAEYNEYLARLADRPRGTGWRRR